MSPDASPRPPPEPPELERVASSLDDAALSLLDHYRRVAQRGALKALPRTGPREFYTDLLPAYLLRPGKGIRPVLCLASCVLHGGAPQDALPLAVSLELLHSAFLVHDDIADESTSRRGRPTLHTSHGVGLAINVGDALATIATRHIRENVAHLRTPVAVEILRAFDQMIAATIEGQALDVGWREHNRFDVSVADYLDMITKKTSWYTTIQPLRMGALAAQDRAVDHAALLRFGSSLGTLFQLVNDLNGLTAYRGGETACEDLLEGKRTLPLLHLHNNIDDAGRQRLRAILSTGRGSRSDDDVNWILAQMEQLGSIAYGQQCVRSMAVVAQRNAEDAFAHVADCDARTLVLGITSYVACSIA